MTSKSDVFEGLSEEIQRAIAELGIHKARETWGDKVFPIEIPDTIAFPRAFSKGQPLLAADPEHEAAKAYP